MSVTALVLTLFIAWTLLLLVLMEVLRSRLVVTARAGITDPLAPWLLAARVVQSSIHLASLSPAAVTARFAAFAVQMAIAVYWVWALLAR